ncbi:MAG: cysteine desulfurase family protein [Pyrinomonadaceae bacterium]
MFRRIYLDNAATTPLDPRVLEAMMPYLTEDFGNASSIHYFGQRARAAVDKARHEVADLINSRPNEIVFTSGGTESNNLAVRGLLQANAKYGRHIIATAIEHPAVRNVLEDLEKDGAQVTFLPAATTGVVSVDDLRAAIRQDTVLITVMTANNEIGTLQPVDEIGKIVRDLRSAGKKIWFHTDAVQAAGKIRLDVEEIGCDLLSISAHKIYGPKGVGALYVRRGTRLHSQNIGGRQERGIRGGTEAVAPIVGFGAAARLASDEIDTEPRRIAALRDRLERSILESISGTAVNGDVTRRLPNITNISFAGVEGEGLLINLDIRGIAVSTGSACSSGSLEPSPVIRALGASDQTARTAIRFSLGRQNVDDVEMILQQLSEAVGDLRRISAASSK